MTYDMALANGVRKLFLVGAGTPFSLPVGQGGFAWLAYMRAGHCGLVRE